MQTLSEVEVEEVGAGLSGWGFFGAVLGITGAAIAVAAAPAIGAATGVFTIAAIGANAIDSYSRGQ